MDDAPRAVALKNPQDLAVRAEGVNEEGKAKALCKGNMSLEEPRLKLKVRGVEAVKPALPYCPHRAAH